MSFKKLLVCFLCISIILVNNSVIINAEDNEEQIEEEVDYSLGEKGGYLAGNYLSTKSIYEQRRFTWGEGGKGFAAEKANNLSDVLNGKNAKIVGNDNLKNGADRIIINRDESTTLIQDKYYSTASKSVAAAFDSETGIYKYVDGDGKPMQLEIPKGQGDEAVKIMKRKIKDGQVAGVTDPNEAENIIREGKYTFKQAVNITKAGNIDSLVYDAKSGTLTSIGAMGITFTLDFMSCIINGDDWKTSLKNASLNSLKVGIGVEVMYVVSSQLARTNAPLIFKPATDKMASLLGPKASKALVELLGEKNQVITENAVSGILKNNFLINTVTIAVFSVPDAIDLFNGRISAKQFAMNLAVLIGGTSGATLGMVVGGSIGGVAGGFIGGIAGGTVGKYASDTLLTTIFKSDSEEMFDIVANQFSKVSEDYLVSQNEAELITENLSKQLSTKTLKNMYESEDREKFANDLITKTFENQISKREKVTLPTQEQMRNQMINSMDGLVYIH